MVSDWFCFDGIVYVFVFLFWLGCGAWCLVCGCSG